MSVAGISEFAPDMPDLPSDASDTIFNVVPATAASYGPMPSHQPFSSALVGRCQGGLSITDSAGNVRVFAGDATKLYRLAPPGTTPADVSKAGSYTTGSSSQWRMALFGTRTIATNFSDPIQSYVESVSSNFADMIATGLTSLRAHEVAVVKDWVFLGNTTDATYGDRPQRVHFLAINDPTNAPTPGTQAAANALSDFQDMPGPHGKLQAIAGNLGTANAGIFFERAVYRAIYVGLPDIFDFLPAEGARGLLATGAMAQYGDTAYYPSEDGFYAFDGSNSAPIGKGRVDTFFYKDLQSSYLDRISSVADPARGLIFWAYPGAGSSNGNPNRLLIYSPVFNKWAVTAANSVQIEFLMRGATFGKTLEQLDTFGTLDALPFPLDSQVWAGGRSVLAAFDVNHKYGYFDGANLPATVDSTDFELAPGNQVTVHRARPLVDLSTATLAVAARDKISQSVVFGTAQAQEPNGSCSVPRPYNRGRYHRGRIQTQLGDVWSHISGIDLEEFDLEGSR